ATPPFGDDRRDGQKLRTMLPRGTQKHHSARLLSFHCYKCPGVERRGDHAARLDLFRLRPTISFMNASNGASSIGGARRRSHFSASWRSASSAMASMRADTLPP